jgi:hypothetical protein
VAEKDIAAFGKSCYFATMSVTGKIKNGVVELPPGAKFPEGAEVKVETLLAAADDPFVAAVEKLARPRPHLPGDYALNHGHYVGGEPKR